MTKQVINSRWGHVSIKLFNEIYKPYNNGNDSWDGECGLCSLPVSKAVMLNTGNEFYCIFACKDCIEKALIILED